MDQHMSTSGNLKKPTGGYLITMECPVCKSNKSKVVDKRNYEDHILRRRECNNGHRFNTIELDEHKPSLKPAKGMVDTTKPEFGEKLKSALIASVDYRKLAQQLYITL